MIRFVTLFALLALSFVTASELKFDEGDDRIVVLSMDGEADGSVSVLFRDTSGEETAVFSSGNPRLMAGEVEVSIGQEYTNFTFPLTFKGVGTAEFSVAVGEEEVTGTFIAAGFSIMNDDGEMVSGDGNGIEINPVSELTLVTFPVRVVGIDGSSVDISDTMISTAGTDSAVVDLESTSISSTEFVLGLSPYRFDVDGFRVEFEAPSIELNGEVHENVLIVTQTRTAGPEPMCVAVGGDLVTEDGVVKVTMFNTLSPPLDADVMDISITIGGETTSFDRDLSDLSQPTQTIAFRTLAGGPATITCDGVDAIIKGGELTVSGGSVSPEPIPNGAMPQPTPEASPPFTTFEAEITIETIDLPDLKQSDVDPVVAKCCEVTGGMNCTLTATRQGSSIITVVGLINGNDSAAAGTALEECFDEPECECQKDLGYDCDSMTLNESRFDALGASGAATGGLATWTIVLIAVVGAFALIVVILLGMWAVHNKSKNQSDSDYSSSGPLGVPDPSDLLYEQSIVRDIYGRGDFPDGGPSQAVAEQRAREAEMREEFPRPPSSSGLSRGAATDDASSTYSV
eukprot:GFKZ01006776.1.p1 GENE.GFKZ01006776.1~~GFKZ01006776.1.p1  ORF type:complete len:571 (+),score=81.69 GFKZ01006776.1:233-1945(+)